MIDRIRRSFRVALNGRLVPAPQSEIRIERARGERTLYRLVAQIDRSDKGIARAASRWGPLARLPADIEVLTTRLAAFFSVRRDGWVADARSPSGASGMSDRLNRATRRAMSRGIDAVIERTRREYEFSDEDMAALQAASNTDLRSTAAFIDGTTRTVASMRECQPTSGPLPRWARELDEAGDLRASVERFADGLGGLGRARTTAKAARAIESLLELRPAGISAVEDDDERNAILAPLIDVIERIGRGEPDHDEETDSLDAATSRAVTAALVTYWKAGDTPGVEAPRGVQVPQLADPDTWRTVFAFASATPQPVGKNPWIAAERADDWRDFSIECALWRDAIDALGRVETGDDALDADDVRAARAALAALARRVGSRLGLPFTDLAELDPAVPGLVRERLLRWVAARCALAGVDPRPRSGALGTEGRAVLSIQDALMDAEPRRRCAWLDCRELLPPQSYAHRQYCDTHLRQKASERAARRRATQRPAT